MFLMFGLVPLWHWGYLQKKDFPYYMGVLALLAVFNALSQGGKRDILVHLWVDLLAAVGLLFVSGSANNPFVSILCVHAFLGGMLLSGTRTFIFEISILLLLSLLQIETYLDSRTTQGANSSELFLHFLSQWIVISVSWFVSQYFSGVLHKNENQIRLLQARQQQADRLKALGALTAGFSHELATPMNSLSLRMDRGVRKLQQGDSSALEELEKAQNSLVDCLRIFRKMATVFSRSSQVELQTVDLTRLVPELLQSWKREHPTALIEEHFLNETLLCRLQLLSFSQTFFDLLDNAFEASPAEKPVIIRLYKKAQTITLEVRDEGAGLTEEILSRFGEPFVTSKAHGNGLGLYSAIMMAQAAGGEFKIANNTTGPGAIARICLPVEEE